MPRLHRGSPLGMGVVMALLMPLSEGAPSSCHLCDQAPEGALGGPAVVDPWSRAQRTPPVVANLRRVLKAGDALCQSCGDACSYDVGGAR